MDHVLVVCTANICRSPLAEVLLRSWLEHHSPAAADQVAISSAGVRARDGYPAAEHMLAIGDRWGLDLHRHASRPATAELVEQATLVLTMEEAHRDVIARVDPGAAARTFTLPEFVEVAEQLHDVRGDAGTVAPADPGLPGLVQRLHGARARVWVSSPDVEDPYGGPAGGYEVTARELVDLVERAGPVLAAALTPTSPRQG